MRKSAFITHKIIVTSHLAGISTFACYVYERKACKELPFVLQPYTKNLLRIIILIVLLSKLNLKECEWQDLVNGIKRNEFLN